MAYDDSIYIMIRFHFGLLPAVSNGHCASWLDGLRFDLELLFSIIQIDTYCLLLMKYLNIFDRLPFYELRRTRLELRPQSCRHSQ